MEGQEDPQTPEPSHELQTPRQAPRVAVGDTVNVFQGTGAYVRGNKTVAFIGTVVGYDANEGKWLVLLVLLPCLSCLVMFCDVYCSPMCRSVISWRQNVDFRARSKNNSCQG